MGKSTTQQFKNSLDNANIKNSQVYDSLRGSFNKMEPNEATGTGSSGAFEPLFSSKKIEATEATSTASSGSYETPAMWAKSTKKKDWRGKSKTQIPGGAFVSVKEKCKKFPYCNQGDIKALNIYKNESLKRAITNYSNKSGLSEYTIKAILEYEFELNDKLKYLL